eukprot:Skav215994  [mRNA]  locus=scaffold4693:140018:158914:+ [translate_table: standard]
MYSLSQCAVAPYLPDLLKVTKSDTIPKEATALLPPHESTLLLHPEEYLVRSPDEIEDWAAENADFQPYWDETLRCNRELRLDLYRRLAEKSLVGFRRRIKSKVGIFFVWKSEKKGIRMIIDARMPNACHKKPPKTKLGGAAGLSELDLFFDTDDVGALESGYGGPVELPASLWGNTGDVSDAFYQFSVAPLAEWFGMDDPVLASEVGVNEVWCPESASMKPVSADEKLFPVFLGMPQGWSWALHLCNTAVEYQMSKTIPPSMFVKDGMPSPDPRRGPVGSVYVDNIGVFGVVESLVSTTFDAAVENLERAGFVLHELERGSQEVANVGVVLHRDTMTLRHSRKRTWRLYLALKHALRLKKITGEAMRVLAGHIVHFFSIQRSGLACLHHVYRFIFKWLDGRGHVIPSSVKRELRMVVGLIFQVEVDLAAPYCPDVFCGDSSSYGYCFQRTAAPPSEQRSLVKFHERWRFLEVEHGIGKGLGSHHSWSADFEVPNIAYVRWLHERCDLPAPGSGELEPGSVGRTLDARPTSEVSLVGMVPKLPDTLLDPKRWQTIVKRKWKMRESIHMLEGRVALMSLRRECKNPRSHGCRILTLCDNLSAVTAFDRGRARDYALLSLCRRAAALQIGCGVRWHLRYVESSRNPSDKDSRDFSHSFKRRRKGDFFESTRDRYGPQSPEPLVDKQSATRPLPSSSSTVRGSLRPTADTGRGRVVGSKGLVEQSTYVGRERRASVCDSLDARDPLLGIEHEKSRHDSGPADSEGHLGLSRAAVASSSTRSTKQTFYKARSSAKTCSSVPVTGVSFLELFSGSSRLTSAVYQAGMRVGPPFDTINGCEYDLSRHAVQRMIKDWIAQGRVWYLHLGTPCTIFSIANKGQITGSRLKSFLGAAKFTAELIKLCGVHGVWYSLENPKTSKLFKLTCIRDALKVTNGYYVDYDCGRFGCPFRKSTRLATNCSGLATLGRRCQCRGPHPEQLRGRGHCVMHGLPHYFLWLQAKRFARPVKHQSFLAGIMKFKKSLAANPKSLSVSHAPGVTKRHGPQQLTRGELDPKQTAQRAADRAKRVDTQPGFLRRARLRKEVTRQVYSDAWNAFLSFCVDVSLLPSIKCRFVSMHQIDTALEAFAENQFLMGSSKYILTCALQNTNIEYPMWPTSCRSNYPLTKAAKKGWTNIEPGASKDPCPYEVACLIAMNLLERNLPWIAAGVMVCFDTYLRPGKLCGLQFNNVVPPSRGVGKQYAFWTLLLNPHESGVPSKVGEFNDSLVVGTADREWGGSTAELFRLDREISGRRNLALLANVDLIFEKIAITLEKCLEQATLSDWDVSGRHLKLLVLEFAMLDKQVAPFRSFLREEPQDDGLRGLDLDELQMLENHMVQLARRVGLHVDRIHQSQGFFGLLRKQMVWWSSFWQKIRRGLVFQDLRHALRLVLKAAGRGCEDLLVLVPFLIILLIPLSPPGHMLVFSLILKVYPDFVMRIYKEIQPVSEKRSLW